MQDLILIFDITSYHVAQRNVNWHILGVLQHENKDTWEKQNGSKYFLTYCFINLLVDYLLHTAPYVIYRWRNILAIILNTSNFRSTLAAIIEVNKHDEAKSLLGICCTVVSDHTLQVSNSAKIFAYSTTLLSEVCLEPLWPSCGHGVKSTSLLGQPNGLRFCYTQSRSVKSWSSSNIVLSLLHFFPILLNLMQKIDNFVPILGRFWPYLACF